MRRTCFASAVTAAALLTGCASNDCTTCATESCAAEPALASTVSPFLMFQDGRAEEAMGFYVDAFPEGQGRIVSIERYGPGAPAPEGQVQFGVFEVRGQQVLVTDSPPVHEFGFTPSVSLFVLCAEEADFDARVAALVDGGEFLMPPNNYGFSRKFAWINDRFGVSWQVNLP